MKRIISWFLTISLFCMFTPITLAAGAGYDNFTPKNPYQAQRFVDVPQGAWFEESVKTAYELGLVTGNTETTYNPNGNITIAEVLALACRLHRIYATGIADFPKGEPWYQPYVDYALGNLIIWDGQFSDYTAIANRAEFSVIMSNALPDEAWTPINDISKLPDVASDAFFASDVRKLYNCGVLTGSDQYGTFHPLSSIQRSEVAAIVSRMAKPELRRSFTLVQKPVAVTSIALSGPDSLYSWETISLMVNYAPEDATHKSVTWSSSDPEVAEVSAEGTVTGKLAGTSTITATTANGVSASKTITVLKRPSIGAPLTDSTLFKDGVFLGFYTDSVGGVHVSWKATNLSGKTINYYTCYITMYNPVGDLAYDQIGLEATKTIKIVGPVAPGETLLLFDNLIGYSAVCDTIVMDKIYLEYADGTTEMVQYGYSGGETAWNQYYNNF